MKKLFAVLALAGLMVACNSKKKAEKTSGTENTTNTNDQTTTTNDNTTVTSNVTGVPTFADAEVQQYANDITAFVNAYLEALRSKNYTKAAELAPKWMDWTNRSASISMKLANNPEESKKWSDYWEKIGEEWEKAAKEMVPDQQ
jgi:hypothetical protein